MIDYSHPAVVEWKKFYHQARELDEMTLTIFNERIHFPPLATKVNLLRMYKSNMQECLEEISTRKDIPTNEKPLYRLYLERDLTNVQKWLQTYKLLNKKPRNKNVKSI